MAVRMSHDTRRGIERWIASMVVGLVLVAAWRLPLDSWPPTRESVRSAEAIRYGTVIDDYRITEEVLRRVLWSDSLSEAAVSSADEGVFIATPETSKGIEAQKARLERKAELEMSAVGAENQPTVFGYVVQPHDHGAADSFTSPSGRDRTETLVGTRDGTDYCLQVRVRGVRFTRDVIARELTETDWVAPRTNLLGLCRLYLAYGTPGRRIQAWLEQGGAGFAQEHGGDELRTPDRFRVLHRRTGLLGMTGLMAGGSRPLVADRCIAGYVDACETLFERPLAPDTRLERDFEVIRRSPVTSIGSASYFASTLLDDGFMIADLEAEFGREAFGRFWTSGQEVGPAFEAAFGTDTGTWVSSWVDRAVGIDRPGPRLSRATTNTSMLAVLLLLGIAFARTRRERRSGA